MAEGASRGARPLVVKVGGSLAETGRLATSLNMIAAAHVPVVVVPGGGPFADGVRALQPTMKFPDDVAHRLAMLAMHQMAELIVALQPGFAVAENLEEITDLVVEGDVPVWAPLRMIRGDKTISADWSATSDTLAARLAELLGARLALLKSVDVDPGASAEDLSKTGVVDPVFPTIVARAGLSWVIFGPRDDARFAAVLAGEGGSDAVYRRDDRHHHRRGG